eukprot:m.127549 g.127549  ORF g.127549 m.127549 type:complete len:433 (+) comp9727_c0_seq1:44-1342(+)
MALCTDLHALAIEPAGGGQFAFLLQVTCVDGSSYVVKRTHDELYVFQCKLLDLNPVEAGKTGEQRIIPRLPGKKATLLRKSITQQRTIAEKRLPLIQRWATNLAKLPEALRLSEHFVSFFASTAQAHSETSLVVSTTSAHGVPAEEIARVGFLTKQGGSHKSWKRRHCLLRISGKLSYFLDDEARVATKDIDLSSVLQVLPGTEEHPPNGWPEGVDPACGFCVEVPRRTFYFHSTTALDARAWMQCVREVSRSMTEDGEEGSLASATAHALCSGHLTKQGGSHKSWKERYCVLSVSGQLSWSADKHGSSVLGSFNAADIEGIRPGDVARPPYDWPPSAEVDFAFAVETPARNYFFFARSEVERAKWMTALSQAARSGVERRQTMALERRQSRRRAQPTDTTLAEEAEEAEVADLDVDIDDIETGEDGSALPA